MIEGIIRNKFRTTRGRFADVCPMLRVGSESASPVDRDGAAEDQLAASAVAGPRAGPPLRRPGAAAAASS